MLFLLAIKIQALSCAQVRCPYCHQDLGPSREACGRCCTLHHPECLAEYGRCTVLGCRGPAPLRRVRGPERGSRAPVQVPPPWTPLRRVVAGFALASLLAVTGLCLLPDLASQRPYANEAAAIGGLKAIANAQTLYREGDKDGDGTLAYAPSLEALVNTGPDREDLIDEVLAGGTKQGYTFSIASASSLVWTATANPTVPGTTGDRYFGGNMAGMIFFSTERPVRFNSDGSSDDPTLSH